MRKKLALLTMIAMSFIASSFATTYNFIRVGAPTNTNNPNAIINVGSSILSTYPFYYYSSGNTGGAVTSAANGTVSFYVSNPNPNIPGLYFIGSVNVASITTINGASFVTNLTSTSSSNTSLQGIYSGYVSLAYGTTGIPFYSFSINKQTFTMPPPGGGF